MDVRTKWMTLKEKKLLSVVLRLNAALVYHTPFTWF